MEGFQDYQLPLTITFIDFKAFDSIDRKVMFAVLRYYGIPVDVVNALIPATVHCTSTPKVQYWWTGIISYPFEVSIGVLQGDSSIRLHYSSWLLLWGRPHQILTRELKHTLTAQDDIQSRYWMPCSNPQWPRHRPSLPVQHQQQKILAL